MSKHTPGPWTVDPAARPGHVDKIKSGGVAFVGVGCTTVGGNQTEQSANARLIAAAPDLLEACRLGLRLGEIAVRAGMLHETPDSFVEEVVENHHGLKTIRAAIAKAEGK